MTVTEIDRRVATTVVDTLLATRPREKFLIVTDATGVQENGSIVEAVVEKARAVGAETILVQMDDASEVGVEYLPEPVAEMMPHTDIVVGLTRTTSAPFPHHRVPIGLVRSGAIRGVFMVKRSYSDLTDASVLDADYPAMSSVADKWQAAFRQAEHIEITCENGTKLTASMKDMPSFRSNFAHQPGTMSPINWGEVYQAPVPGTSNGQIVVDGPVLGFGWPESMITIHVEEGRAIAIEGETEVAEHLWRLATENENGTNIGEIALGINARANDKSINVYKKGLGRMHLALGNGLVYGQPIDSPIHVDVMVTAPTVTLDGDVVVDAGKPT